MSDFRIKEFDGAYWFLGYLICHELDLRPITSCELTLAAESWLIANSLEVQKADQVVPYVYFTLRLEQT
ncbi:unnamed protein product [Haemonchus placei]|uniref:Type I restriction endonuclease subunit R n=1 Tax=Haemonchus placei TaxID=6290 RepID=A0A0N4WEF9_HAEPC|nr:unnamed protein product [Haemonchus placei]